MLSAMNTSWAMRKPIDDASCNSPRERINIRAETMILMELQMEYAY